MFAAKGGMRKLLWGFGLLSMTYAVVATYSRSGMIAMVITLLICMWEFGIKGKRILLILGSGIIGILAVVAILVQPQYLSRMETLFHKEPVQYGSLESRAQGSMEDRSILLKESLHLMMQHPLFGVGPGNFPVQTQEWLVAHNTYSELGAEAGVPAIFLFVLLLIMSLRKIRSVRKLPGYAEDENIRLWTSALWVAMAAYIVGAMFASTEYNLFPYFMVGYICALYQIASKPTSGGEQDGGRSGQAKPAWPGNGDKSRELAWSR